MKKKDTVYVIADTSMQTKRGDALTILRYEELSDDFRCLVLLTADGREIRTCDRRAPDIGDTDTLTFADCIKHEALYHYTVSICR